MIASEDLGKLMDRCGGPAGLLKRASNLGKNLEKKTAVSPNYFGIAGTTLSYQRLEDEVLHLPRMDRSQLASRLLESLEEEEHELSPEWREELQQRVASIDAGNAKLIPAEDLWKEIGQRFGSTF
jgi:putative addiction module component (TIGR02574 family)